MPVFGPDGLPIFANRAPDAPPTAAPERPIDRFPRLPDADLEQMARMVEGLVLQGAPLESTGSIPILILGSLVRAARDYSALSATLAPGGGAAGLSAGAVPPVPAVAPRDDAGE